MIDLVCNLCGSKEADVFHEESGYKYLKCKSCGLLFRDKVDLDEMLDFYEDDGVTEDRDLTGYFGGGDFRWRIALDEIMRHKQSGRLFEIGCGGGALLAEAKRSGFDVYGCDIAKSRVNIINKYLGGERVIFGDFERSEFPDGKYDVVVMMDVLSHFKSLTRVMNRAAGLLAPGGILYLKGGNFGEFNNMDEVYREGINLMTQIHFYHLNIPNMRMLFHKSGLRILKLDTIALHKLSGGFFGSDKKNYLFQPVSDIIGKTLYRLNLRKAAEVIVVAQKSL